MLRFTVGCKGFRLPGPPSARADFSSWTRVGLVTFVGLAALTIRARRAGGGGQGTRPGSHGDPLFSIDLVSRAGSGLSREILESGVTSIVSKNEVELPNRSVPV